MINELIYTYEYSERAYVQNAIDAKWPGKATYEDASDEIHGARFMVNIDDVESDDFYVFAMLEGFVRICFGFQVMTMTEESVPDVRRIIDRAKAEKAKLVIEQGYSDDID